MKRALSVVAVVLVCTPMVLMLASLLAVKWPKMDGLTMRMPMGVRSTVTSGVLALSTPGDKTQLQRAMRLDAATATEYRPPAIGVGATPPKLEELYKQQRENRAAAKELSKRAVAQEAAGKACAAEDLYADAAGKDVSEEIYVYTEGLGRAGLKCGDLPGARAGLEAAILKQTAFLKGTDEDQLTDVRRDMLKDREFLVVVYDKQHESGLATTVCSEAHPGWRGCSCALVATDVKCEESGR